MNGSTRTRGKQGTSDKVRVAMPALVHEGETKLKETKRDSDASHGAIGDTGDSHLNPMITSLCRLGSLKSYDDKSRESDDDKC